MLFSQWRATFIEPNKMLGDDYTNLPIVASSFLAESVKNVKED